MGPRFFPAILSSGRFGRGPTNQLRGRKQSPWWLPTYKSWDDAPGKEPFCPSRTKNKVVGLPNDFPYDIWVVTLTNPGPMFSCFFFGGGFRLVKIGRFSNFEGFFQQCTCMVILRNFPGQSNAWSLRWCHVMTPEQGVTKSPRNPQQDPLYWLPR